MNNMPQPSLQNRSSAFLAQMMQFDLGHREAAEELFRRYLVRMQEWCYKMQMPRDLVDDAVSEACIDIVSKINAFDRTRGPFQAWCRTVTYNAAVSLLRKSNSFNQRHRQGDWALIEPEGRETDPAQEVADLLDKDVEWALAQTALARVEKRYKPAELEAFQRRARGEAVKDIAQALNMPANKVYQIYYKLVNELRVEVGQLSLDGPTRQASGEAEEKR